uniref:Uncharacterized protein n=1 Tax=Anguilla anguilla TaxID=7936 RepID=A0A0E9W4Q6_ANGAN
MAWEPLQSSVNRPPRCRWTWLKRPCNRWRLCNML